MTNPYPEFTPEVELQDVRYQVHIYEAITIAANDAHGVLDIVLSASDPDAAHRALAERYDFTDAQAWAVMEVQYRRLTSSDRDKIERRHRELNQRIEVLERQLGRA